MPGPAVLIFDGDCPVCRRAAEWVRRNAAPGAFEYLPCRSEERARRFPGIQEAECLRAMQLVLPDGAVLAGERAVPGILARTRRYAFVAKVFGWPGAAPLSRIVYGWIAGHRHGISRVLFPGPPRG